MTCEHVKDVAAYALGTLEVADRERLEAHVPGCAECQEVLASVAGLPRLLALVPPDAVRSGGTSQEDEPFEARPSEAMYQRLLAAALTRRRSRRRLALIAAAAVLVVGGSAGGVAVLHARSAPAVQVVAGSAGEVKATVWLRELSNGTAVRLRLSGVPSEEHCSLVVVDRDGHREVASTWVATYSGTATIDSSTAIPRSRVSWLRIETSDATLVAMPVPR
jgi:anti-sigma-K factor RskA